MEKARVSNFRKVSCRTKALERCRDFIINSLLAVFPYNLNSDEVDSSYCTMLRVCAHIHRTKDPRINIWRDKSEIDSFLQGPLYQKSRDTGLNPFFFFFLHLMSEIIPTQHIYPMFILAFYMQSFSTYCFNGFGMQIAWNARPLYKYINSFIQLSHLCLKYKSKSSAAIHSDHSVSYNQLE